MSEFYVSCSFYNFYQFIGNHVPNERGEYLLECGHAYSLFPPLHQSDDNIFYLHILVPNLCKTNGHLQKIRDNLRYQFNQSELVLIPYHRLKSNHSQSHQFPNVPYVTHEEPIRAQGSDKYEQMIHKLFCTSEQVMLFEWKNNYHKPTRQDQITYYAHVVTEMVDCQVTFKNFWSGQIQDLTTALKRKETIEREPFKYLKTLPVSYFRIKQPMHLLQQFLDYQLIEQFHDNLIPIILHYYRQTYEDSTLPYPRMDAKKWDL